MMSFAFRWLSHSSACLSVLAHSQVEFDTIFGETGVSTSLERLDSLLARQPELPDGTRLCAPRRSSCLLVPFSATRLLLSLAPKRTRCAPRIPHSAHADSPSPRVRLLPAACTQPAHLRNGSERPHRRRDAAHQASAQGTARGGASRDRAGERQPAGAVPGGAAGAAGGLGRDRRMQGPRREDGHKLRALASGQRVRRSDERADEKNGRTMRRHASGLFAVCWPRASPTGGADAGTGARTAGCARVEVAVSRAGPWRVAIRSGAANATVGASDGTPSLPEPHQFRHLSSFVHGSRRP